MKFSIFITLFLMLSSCTKSQTIDWDWYSETDNKSIIIQNSFPKGGPYNGPATKHYNYSYLVFFTRVINETEDPFELAINFSADSVEIPNSPGTFMKLFLPPDTMSLDKENLFSYGVTDLKSLDKPTSFERTLASKEECLFYVVAIFYQTDADLVDQPRGGNRAELLLEGQNLFYRISPQLDSLPCGQILF